MARIAIAGFQHETSSFAPTKAGYEAFATPGGWPGLTRGPAILEAVAGINLPVAGFIDAARADGHELAPALWCHAPPSAPVTEAAYERIAGMLLEDLAALMPADAVYLDLHGAMVAEHLEDGEGELLGRVRALVGPDMPVVASLDLHANLTPAMVAAADALPAFRTYPHLDMAETGARAAEQVGRLLGTRSRRHTTLRQAPFLAPITSQCTLVDPARALYAAAREVEGGGAACVSLCMGFPLADIRDCGPAVAVHGSDEAAVGRAAEEIAGLIESSEVAFASEYWTPDDAVRRAMALAGSAGRPVILADTQDNPGAGGDGDTTGIIESLVRLGAQGAVVALLNDAEAARAAHAAGEGADIEIAIGEGSGQPGHRPYRNRFRVARLGDGAFTATGPFYAGSRMRLGPMALLEVGGVGILVASRKQQAADQAMLRHLGVEPAAQKILALKSSVHFRADFQALASEILIVTAPGPCIADTTKLAYKRLRPGVRVGPGGPAFAGG